MFLIIIEWCRFFHGSHQTYICLTKLNADSKSFLSNPVTHKHIQVVVFHSQVWLHPPLYFCVEIHYFCVIFVSVPISTIVAAIFTVLFMFLPHWIYHQNFNANSIYASVTRLMELHDTILFVFFSYLFQGQMVDIQRVYKIHIHTNLKQSKSTTTSTKRKTYNQNDIIWECWVF